MTDQEQVDALYAVQGFDHDLEAELRRARVLGVRPFDAERVHVSQTYELVLDSGHLCDISVEGPEPELVDRNQPVLNLRDGTTITCTDDPEEWVRGLGAAFRTPYLSARVVEDTNPLPDVEIGPANVKEPVFR